MQLTREAIQRMVGDRMGGGTGGGGGISASMLAGLATEAWVSENYLSIEFFSKLFKAYDSASTPNEVLPNDTDSTITNIKAMFGFWTEQYISALGQNGSSGGGGASTLAGLLDVAIQSPQTGQVLTYDGATGKWVNGAGGSSGSTDWSDITGKPSTIAGYGITDAKIQNGTIILGGNSITPITDIQLSGTLWGQAWTNGGTVTGNMTNVGTIMMGNTLWMNYYEGPGLRAEGFNSSGTMLWATLGLHNRPTGGGWYNGDGLMMMLVYDTGSSAIARRYIRAYDAVRIGDGMLMWDSTNNAFKVVKADGTAANMYATGSVSALGMSAGASAVDAMTFGTLNVTNTLKVKKDSYSNDIYTNNSGKLYIESNAGTWIEGGMTVNDSDLEISGDSSLRMNGNYIYLSQNVYIYTDGSDVCVNIGGTNYKLYKI